MSLKKKITSLVAGMLMVQGVLFADQAADIMNNTALTDVQKQEQVALAIADLSENGGDVAAFVESVVALTPAESKDGMLAAAVIAVSQTAGAPQTLANIIAAVDVADGAKIVAAVALSAVNTGLDTQALNTALQNAGIDSAQMATLNQASANPTAYISAATVQAAQTLVPTPPPAPAPGGQPIVINPNIVAPEVTGYGLSTE